MIYILNIETTTTNCSVSISRDGTFLSLKEDNDANYSHAESLHVFIEEIIIESEIAKTDVSAIAISEGPGSYTGLRIGTSAAKGLCYALGIPLISTSTLQALAMQVKIKNGLIIAMLDARRQEVYSAIFDKDYNVIRETQAQVLTELSFQKFLNKGNVYFIGNANDKTSEIINHKNAIFLEPTLPSASEMISLSHKKFVKRSFEDLAYYQPLYLKEFMSKTK